MRFLPLTFIAIFIFFMAQGLGRTIYVNHYEFWPAAEWHTAHDRGDKKAMLEAMHKEKIAHCRTIDYLWFYQPWANIC